MITNKNGLIIKIFLYTFVTIFIVLLCLSLIFFIAFGGLYIFAPAHNPEIKYAEFDFRIEYEINGRRKTYSNTMICEFDGYEIDEGRGKSTKWTKRYKKNAEDNRLVIHRFDDRYILVLSVGTAEYFMGNQNLINETNNEPYISVYDLELKQYITNTTKANNLLENSEFKIISWQCDNPIQNSFN